MGMFLTGPYPFPVDRQERLKRAGMTGPFRSLSGEPGLFGDTVVVQVITGMRTHALYLR